MKVEHLREFAVLARHLSFTVAAKELFIAQSTLSTHMAALERELGFSLFRRGDDVQLTPEGTVYLQDVQMVLDALDAAADKCRAMAATGHPLRIAMQCPPPSFARFLKERLGFPFAFASNDYQEPFFSAFTNDEADLLVNYDYRQSPALTREADRLGLVARPIAGAPLTVTVSSHHPLAAKEHVRREDLRGETVVIGSVADYERWKDVITQMMGADLGLRFELGPVGDLTNLTFYDYGDRLHVCSKELNEQYLGRRDDIRIIDRIEGVDLVSPQVACWRRDAEPDVAMRVERFCDCWDEFMK